MAINFPDNPPVDFIFTDPVSGGEWQWDGEKWNILPPPTRDSMVPPNVDSATLTKTTTGDRFTSQTYHVSPNVLDDGDPESEKFARVKFTNPTGIIEARPETDAIESVGTEAFSDDFEINSVNDNSWSYITYAGAPYNCYIAVGTGSSTDNIATSVDGQNWERHSYQLNGSNANPADPYLAWCPLDGRLYHVGRRYTGGSTTQCELYKADEGTYNFTKVGDVSTPGNGVGDSHNSWTQLYWNYNDARWYMNRTSSQNSRSGGLERGPTTTDPTSGWTDIATACGSTWGRMQNYGPDMIAGLYSNNQGCGGSGSGYDRYIPNIASSSTGYNITSGGKTRMGRWAKVGNVRWVACLTPGNQGGTGNRISTKDGDTMPNNTTVNQLDPTNWADYPEITYFDGRDALYIDELGIVVICGQASTATREKHGVLLTSTDALTWNLIWTNQPGDDNEYRWESMFWSTDRQELVLVANSGTNPSMRFGYTQTVGETVDLPLLNFVSAQGLAAFSNGMDVEERNGDATGIVAATTLEPPTMLVKASQNTWDVGSRVLGPASRFGDAFGNITSDGNVFGVTTETTFTQLDSDRDFDVEFPATFVDGTVPDTVLPADTTIEVEYRARSEVNGFIADSDVTTNQITPT